MNNSVALKKVQLPNGETMAYREKGNGDKNLILLHGNMSSSQFWDVFMEVLSNDMFHIIAPDLRGFGDSSYKQPIDVIKDFSDDIKQLADMLGFKKFILIGWSLGSLVAEQYTSDYSRDVSSLILIAGTATAYAIPKRDKEGQIIPGEFYATKEEMAILNADTVAALARQDREKIRAGFDRVIYGDRKPEPDQYERYLTAVFKQRNKLDADFAVLQFNISHAHNGLKQGSGEIDKIVCPTLVIQGEHDLVVPQALGKNLVDEIGDNAKLLMLPCGHSPFTDCLDTLVGEIMDFIVR